VFCEPVVHKISGERCVILKLLIFGYNDKKMVINYYQTVITIKRLNPLTLLLPLLVFNIIQKIERPEGHLYCQRYTKLRRYTPQRNVQKEKNKQKLR